MKRWTTKILFTFLLTVYGAGNSLAENVVTMMGDPCSLPLVTKLAEAYSTRNNEFKVEASKVGCMMGVYKAANGQADIGVSTQNGLDANLPRGANNTIIAKAPIVLVVNKKNPVNNLTYDQIQDIYEGKITNWKELGGKDIEIENVMLAPCVKHTMSKKVIKYGKSISKLLPGKKVNPVKHTNVMVAENAGALGQQLYGYETDDIKVLSVGGVLPNEKTVPGEYTFYEEYNIVTKIKPDSSIEKFIEFAKSDEGRKIILSMKHVPIN